MWMDWHIAVGAFDLKFSQETPQLKDIVVLMILPTIMYWTEKDSLGIPSLMLWLEGPKRSKIRHHFPG